MGAVQSIYPSAGPERDKWILARRPARALLDARQPYAFSLEDERSASGRIVPVATVFLTNRECPWRCLMCDLWRNTLVEDTPVGAIPAQIDYALDRATSARHIKLYNSGSFFDPRAIPIADYSAIASRVNSFEHVIVESHPALINDRCLQFRDLLTPTLEVAMGLETVHPEILPRLNKQMTLPQFAAAAAWLSGHDIALRAFILVKPPFLNDETEAIFWAERSIDFAFRQGASVVSLIPTRAGNGALEALSKRGEFAPPRLSTLEAATEYGVRLGLGRVFADLWDVSHQAGCEACHKARIARLEEINLRQRIPPRVSCRHCGANA
jgi:radical SAM enzyme (TIGR01210 family)